MGDDVRIRICSTGPDTTLFAKPAVTPEVNSCAPLRVFPSGPPMLCDWFRLAKNRFVYSSAPNWIDTHSPIPSSGDRVPCTWR